MTGTFSSQTEILTGARPAPGRADDRVATRRVCSSISYRQRVPVELYDIVQRLRFSHPEVRAVVLTGGKDRIFCAGANIRMLAGSDHTDEAELAQFCRQGIESFKCPRRFVVVEEYPTTATGKIRRVELRAQAEKILRHGEV